MATLLQGRICGLELSLFRNVSSSYRVYHEMSWESVRAYSPSNRLAFRDGITQRPCLSSLLLTVKPSIEDVDYY